MPSGFSFGFSCVETYKKTCENRNAPSCASGVNCVGVIA